MRDIPADELPSGLVRLDSAGRIIEANAVFQAWTGTISVVGRRLADFVDAVEPDRALDEGDILFLRNADGLRRPVLIEGIDQPGLVVVFDATRRQEVEDGLLETHALVRRTQIRLQLVIDASIAFAEATSEDALAELLVQTASRAYAAEESLVFLAGPDGVRPAAGTYPFGDLAYGELLALSGLSRGEVVKISGVDAAYEIAAPLGRAFTSAGVHAVIVAPIRHEAETLGAFACFFLHPRTFDEQASPLASALAGQAGQAVTSMRLQAALEHAATHDQTTGLPNRRFLEERLQAPSSGATTAIIFIDLDGFKRVNDGFGHAVGDLLLREVGERLRAAVRAEHVVARYGGDEFVVVAEVAGPLAASEMAERIRGRLEEPYKTARDVAISASIGVAMADSAPNGTDQLIRLADQAMYAAKGAGGNRVAASAV
ncbi:diguanylate cyclase [Pseudolysinimonas sp.]|uniref:diguanylate cyclase n=1 Tax=Pseudolysinimonas sp. TaxID=2680009 RepID=UPI003F7D95C1